MNNIFRCFAALMIGTSQLIVSIHTLADEGKQTRQEDLETRDMMVERLTDEHRLAIRRRRDLRRLSATPDRAKALYVPVLIQLLHDDEELVREGAYYLLQEFTFQRIVPDHDKWRKWWEANEKKTYEDWKSEVRQQTRERVKRKGFGEYPKGDNFLALDEAQFFDEQEDISFLIELLKNGDDINWKSAATALVRLGVNAAVPVILKHREDGKISTANCIWLLSKFKDERAITFILDQLESEETRSGGIKGGKKVTLYTSNDAAVVLQSTFRKHFYFSPTAPPEERAEAIRRWRSWWEANKDEFLKQE